MIRAEDFEIEEWKSGKREYGEYFEDKLEIVEGIRRILAKYGERIQRLLQFLVVGETVSFGADDAPMNFHHVSEYDGSRDEEKATNRVVCVEVSVDGDGRRVEVCTQPGFNGYTIARWMEKWSS